MLLVSQHADDAPDHAPGHPPHRARRRPVPAAPEPPLMLGFSLAELSSLLTLMAAVAGAQWAAVRWLLARIREEASASHDRDAELHRRLDRLRDDTMRREDLMPHLQRLERGQDQLASGLERLHGRIDGLVRPILSEGSHR